MGIECSMAGVSRLILTLREINFPSGREWLCFGFKAALKVLVEFGKAGHLLAEWGKATWQFTDYPLTSKVCTSTRIMQFQLLSETRYGDGNFLFCDEKKEKHAVI